MRVFALLQNHPINCRRPAIAILFGWLVIQIILSISPAYVPDEGLFLKVVKDSADLIRNGDFSRILLHPNEYGYGGIFWSAYLLVEMFTQAVTGVQHYMHLNNQSFQVMLHLWMSQTDLLPMYGLRIMAWTSLFWLGIKLIQMASGPASILGTVALVTLPIAWWSGKVASPEVFSATLFAYAVLLSFIQGRLILGSLFTALAVGIKLTVAPLGVYLIIWNIISAWCSHTQNTPQKRAQGTLLIGSIAVLMFVLANLWLFSDPQKGVERIKSISSMFHPLPSYSAQAAATLWGQIYSWEGTQHGSLYYWSGSIFFLIASFLSSWMHNKRLFSFLVGGGVISFFFMMTQPNHNWYWFPFILAMLIPLYLVDRRYVALMYIAGVFFITSSNYREELDLRQRHLIEINSLKSMDVLSCMEKGVNRNNIEKVYDMSSIGFLPSLGWHEKIFNYHDSFVHFNSGGDIDTNSALLVGSKTIFIHNFTARFLQAPYSVEQCGEFKIIVNS